MLSRERFEFIFSHLTVDETLDILMPNEANYEPPIVTLLDRFAAAVAVKHARVEGTIDNLTERVDGMLSHLKVIEERLAKKEAALKAARRQLLHADQALSRIAPVIELALEHYPDALDTIGGCGFTNTIRMALKRGARDNAVKILTEELPVPYKVAKQIVEMIEA